RRRLFVASVDHAEAVAHASGVNRVEMSPMQRKNFLNSLTLQGAYDHFAAIDFRHDLYLQYAVIVGRRHRDRQPHFRKGSQKNGPLLSDYRTRRPGETVQSYSWERVNPWYRFCFRRNVGLLAGQLGADYFPVVCGLAQIDGHHF